MTAPVIDLAAIRNAEAEVAWFELMLEHICTVDGGWRDWDWRLQGPDQAEKAAEECAEALRQWRERLANLRRPLR